MNAHAVIRWFIGRLLSVGIAAATLQRRLLGIFWEGVTDEVS